MSSAHQPTAKRAAVPANPGAGENRGGDEFRSRRTASWVAPSLVLVALSVQGCSLNRLVEGVERTMGVATSIRGDLMVRGEQGSEVPRRPEVCLSGDRANFRGVDLLSEGLVLRVVAEPIDGIAVALIDATTGERRGVFRRSDCTLLRGDIQRTGWQINDVADVSGNLEADCQLPSGQLLRGKLVFEHCH